MEPIYLDQLPEDMLTELALRLPWTDLYEQYIHLPEYRRYDDPNHPLWKALYQRDISSYPLPGGASYRDQFFWAHRVMDRIRPVGNNFMARTWDYDLPTTVAYVYFSELVGLGYDRALRNYLTSITPPNGELDLHIKTLLESSQLINLAMLKGYLTILTDILMVDPAQSPYSMYHIASQSRHLEVLKYVLKIYGEPSKDTHTSMIENAFKAGHAETFFYLLELYNDTYPTDPMDVCKLLRSASMGDNVELVRYVLDNCSDDMVTPIIQLLNDPSGVQTLDVLLFLLKQLPGDHEPYANKIMRLAVKECNLDALDYAFQLGARLDFNAFSASATSCFDRDVHEWVIAHTSNKFRTNFLHLVLPKQSLDIIKLYIQTLDKPLTAKRLRLLRFFAEKRETDMDEVLSYLDSLVADQ